MSEKFSLPRGTADILPHDAGVWRFLEDTARSILHSYHYREIRTPIFEETELFARSMGQTSEVVQKQMLSLAGSRSVDADAGTHLTLRPEGTAAVVRSYIQNSLDRKEALTKVYYLGPMFRGERPQKGRLRQFHQIGAEAIGPQSASPYLDAEMIALSAHLLQAMGVGDVTLKINTLGSVDDKIHFASWLRERLRDDLATLDAPLRESFDQNIFRLLDSKDPRCRALVQGLTLDHGYLSHESKDYFHTLKSALDLMGVPYTVTPALVRGLDYYTHTVFEITSSALGSQDAVGAGGRYNKLVQELGGAEGVDAIGFALGMERILLAREGEPESTADEDLTAFLVALEDSAFPALFALSDRLRRQGISCDLNYKMGSVKSQMRAANKSGARWTIIMGEDERSRNRVAVKNMHSGDQTEIAVDEVAAVIQERERDTV